MFKLATLFVDVVTNQTGFDKAMMAMGGALGALTVATQRMAEQGSNLFETMNKVSVTFGTSQQAVQAMANDMAIQFGAVKRVTLDAASNFGLVLQAAGYTEKASATTAVALTRLADDASSFFNVPLDVALEKIRSGLVGQARPLREFGVLLSKSAVDHELLSMGIKKTHGEFTEQEKVMARVEIITRSLAKAQGDHERTMGSYVNQMKKLKGEMENFTTGIGAGVAGAEAQFMVNVRDKGVMSALGEHVKSVTEQLMPLQVGEAQMGSSAIGRKDTAFQTAADVAAGVQSGLDAKMFAAPPPPRNYAMESWMNLFQAGAEKEFGFDMMSEKEQAKFLKDEAKREKEDAKREKAEAKVENEFMRQFLDLDTPLAKHKKSKMQRDYEEAAEHPGGKIDKMEGRYQASAMGVAEFAAKLRMEQRGGGVPEKQLTELQQIRKAEMDQAKNMAKLLERGFPAVLS